MEREEESYNPIELRVPHIAKEQGSYDLSRMLRELPPLKLPRRIQEPIFQQQTALQNKKQQSTLQKKAQRISLKTKKHDIVLPPIRQR